MPTIKEIDKDIVGVRKCMNILEATFATLSRTRNHLIAHQLILSEFFKKTMWTDVGKNRFIPACRIADLALECRDKDILDIWKNIDDNVRQVDFGEFFKCGSNKFVLNFDPIHGAILVFPDDTLIRNVILETLKIKYFPTKYTSD